MKRLPGRWAEMKGGCCDSFAGQELAFFSQQNSIQFDHEQHIV